MFFGIYGSNTIQKALQSGQIGCGTCKATRKLWACLHPNCSFVGCSTHIRDHFTKHNSSSHTSLLISYAACSHSLCINVKSKVIWCFRCRLPVHSYELDDNPCQDIVITLRTILINPRSLDTVFDPALCEQRARAYQMELKRQQDAIQEALRQEKKRLRREARKKHQEEVLEKRKHLRIQRLEDPLICPPQYKTSWSQRLFTGGVFLRYIPDKVAQREFIFVSEDCAEVMWRDLRKAAPKASDVILTKDITSLKIGSECSYVETLFENLANQTRTDEQREKLVKRKGFVISILTEKKSLVIEAGSVTARNDWFSAFRYAIYLHRSENKLPVLEISVPEEIAENFDL
ncbi:hypothetical protein GEMRC1_003898 [Eukaryota sp. GEM-RC1]